MITLQPPESLPPEALFEAVRESMADLEPWLEWCTPSYCLADSRAWLASQPALRAAGAEHNFSVVDESGRLLGGCGLNQVNHANRFANLGYWIRTSAAGRGVAVEAVRRLAAWAFGQTAFERLEIVVATGNHRSHRVAEKAGAVREGVLRNRLFIHGSAHDAVLYSIVRPAPDGAERKASGATGGAP